MPLPHANEYAEALQHPLRCFRDPELRRAHLAVDAQDNPCVQAGQTSIVFALRNASGQSWALKCFTQEVAGLQRRYHEINDHFLKLDPSWFVGPQYVEAGISVRGRWYPAVKMRWVEGLPLDRFLAANLDEPDVLRGVADDWVRLARELRQAGVAHGALQHDHVLVGTAADRHAPRLYLVDYDTMFVPALADDLLEESGNPNYQHPQRQRQRQFDADMDRFPLLVLFTTLHALAWGGEALWQCCRRSDSLLFCERDFQELETSAVFQQLWRSGDTRVRNLAGKLALASQGPLKDVPWVDELGGATLSSAEQWRVASLLGSAEDRTDRRTTVTAQDTDVRKKSLEISLDDTEANVPDQLSRQSDEDFGLVVDSDPILELPEISSPAGRGAGSPPVAVPPPLPSEYLKAVGTVCPPPLPAAAPVPPPLPPSYAAEARPTALKDPRTLTYEMEAWMPEQVAVMKILGFVNDCGGEVVTSVPGLVRLRLLDRVEMDNPPPGGLLSWLGLARPRAAEPSVLALVELHLDYRERDFQKLLAITMKIAPGGRDQYVPASRWNAYADRIFCDLRGHLIGKN